MNVSPKQLEMPTTIPFGYTMATIDACHKLREGSRSDSSGCTTVAAVHMAHAMQHGHPLLVMADCLVQLACLHKYKFGSPIALDYVLGPEWKDAWEGVHGMLNGDYGHIYNGTVSKILYEALEISGYKESDV